MKLRELFVQPEIDRHRWAFAEDASGWTNILRLMFRRPGEPEFLELVGQVDSERRGRALVTRGVLH